MPKYSIFFLCALVYGCVSIELDEYQPDSVRQEIGGLDKIHIVERQGFNEVYIEKPSNYDDGSTVAYGSNSGAAAVANLILGIADGIGDANRKKNSEDAIDKYKSIEQCLDKKFSADGGVHELVTSKSYASITWAQTSYESELSEIKSGGVDGYLKFSHDRQAVIYTFYRMMMPRNLSTINVAFNIHLKKKLADGSMKVIDSFTINVQDNIQGNVSAIKNNTNANLPNELDLAGCEIPESVLEQLWPEQLANLQYWLAGDGKALNDLRRLAHRDFNRLFIQVMQSYAAESKLEKLVYDKYDFATYTQGYRAIKPKMQKVSLGARIIDTAADRKIIQKYNGDYFSYPTSELPWDWLGF